MGRTLPKVAQRAGAGLRRAFPLASLVFLFVTAPAFANAPEHKQDEGFDDPKLAREWGGVTWLAPSAHPQDLRAKGASDKPTSASTSAQRVVASADLESKGTDATLANRAKPIEGGPRGGTPLDSLADVASSKAWPYAPRLKLAYRKFSVASLPTATTTASGTALSPEAFESLSIDLYPMSWYLRVGTSTQFGWHKGQFDRSGDYFFAQSFSSGFQIPGRITPFVDALAGAGYMRRLQADGSLPTLYYQAGIEAGVEIYLASRAYTSIALGYLHTGNFFVQNSALSSVKQDSLALKFGFGI